MSFSIRSFADGLASALARSTARLVSCARSTSACSALAGLDASEQAPHGVDGPDLIVVPARFADEQRASLFEEGAIDRAEVLPGDSEIPGQRPGLLPDAPLPLGAGHGAGRVAGPAGQKSAGHGVLDLSSILLPNLLHLGHSGLSSTFPATVSRAGSLPLLEPS